MSKRNILITAPSLEVSKNVSGISSVVYTIVNNNKNANYVHFVAGREDGRDSPFARVKDLIKGYLGLYRVLSNRKIDLLHLNMPLNTKAIYRDFITFRIAKMFNLPVLLHLHGGKYLVEKPTNSVTKYFIKYILNKSDTVVTLSDLESRLINNQYKTNNLFALSNCVGAEFNSANKVLNDSNSVKFLFLGRLHESKGLKVIMEAFERLSKTTDLPMYDLTICGAGPLKDEVIEFSLRHPNNVKYLGVTFGQEKIEQLRRSDVFLLPSLYGEGLPMALLEAMAVGVVPIVTEDGSMGEIVQDNVNGFLIERGNVDILVQKLLEVLDAPRDILKISQTTKSFIQERFSIYAYVNTLNGFYEESISRCKKALKTNLKD